MKTFVGYLREQHGETLGFKSRMKKQEEEAPAPSWEYRHEQDISFEEKMKRTGEWLKWLSSKKENA